MAIMVHSQPSATSMSSNAGANGNGFHTGQFLSVADSWEIGEDWEDEYGEYFYEGMSEDIILLDHDVNSHIYWLHFSKNEASWNVSKETYTNSPFSTPQNDVVLQFKLHELDSNGFEIFYLNINDDFAGSVLLERLAPDRIRDSLLS